MTTRTLKNSDLPDYSTRAGEQRWYRTPINWRAAAGVGFFVGLIFLFATGANPWGFSSMIAPTVMGREMAPRASDASHYDFGFMTMHILVSICFALVLACFVHRFRIGKALLCGTAIGVVFYGLNYFICNHLINVSTGTDEATVFATHIAFALFATGAYKGMVRGRLPIESQEPAPIS
jgi:hypothetical protein